MTDFPANAAATLPEVKVLLDLGIEHGQLSPMQHDQWARAVLDAADALGAVPRRALQNSGAAQCSACDCGFTMTAPSETGEQTCIASPCDSTSLSVPVTIADLMGTSDSSTADLVLTTQIIASGATGNVDCMTWHPGWTNGASGITISCLEGVVSYVSDACIPRLCAPGTYSGAMSTAMHIDVSWTVPPTGAALDTQMVMVGDTATFTWSGCEL